MHCHKITCEHSSAEIFYVLTMTADHNSAETFYETFYVLTITADHNSAETFYALSLTAEHNSSGFFAINSWSKKRPLAESGAGAEKRPPA